MYGVAVRKACAGGWGDDSVLGTLSGQVEGSTAESTLHCSSTLELARTSRERENVDNLCLGRGIDKQI